MDKSYEVDTGGATYRSGDPIKNFRLSINLQRVSPAILGFLSSRPATAGDAAGDSGTAVSVSSTSINEFGQTILETENLDCSWQQKFFSAREYEFYSNSPVGGTVQDYKYHNDVQKLKKSGGRRNTRIFTYGENDTFSPPIDEFELMTTSLKEVPTNLSLNVSGLRRRKPAAAPGGNALSSQLKKGQGARGLKIVVKTPSDEFRQNNHVITTPTHRMLIMADLSPEGQLGNPAYEKTLCEIEYDENGVLSINPDFTRSKLPYRVESGLSRDIWLYKIDSTSTTMSRMEIQKEARMLKQLYIKHQKYLSDLVGSEFEQVQTGVLRLVVNGEIIKAQSFEYDDLHIEYFLDLPRNWSCSAYDMLSGCTHTCRTKLEENIETAYYSHPFSYDTYLSYAKEDLDSSNEWPKIFLQVISSDTWGRRRTEGYGYVALPSTPGLHILKAHCWRPTGNAGQESVTNELRRFFIGSSPELEDATYIAVPSNFEGKILNKYGVRTESTGSVTIRINCIVQQQPETKKPDAVGDHIRKRKQQTAIQLAKGKAANEAIHGVMDAFLRARKRMQTARESVPEHIRKTAEDRSRNNMAGDKAQHLSSVLSGDKVWRNQDEDDLNHETSA
ncbi:tectonic-like complex member MKS1 [Styela clava]